MQNLGIALDIGTTTIQGRLIDLKKRKDLSYFACLNEQISIGHDIISRIKFCIDRPNGLEKLNRRLISSVNFVIENLLSSAREDKEKVSTIVAVGNTAMYYFTFSISPQSLITPPYQPPQRELVVIKARVLGLDINRLCKFLFLPYIGGFVGSDALGVILATDLDRKRYPVLAVDIGTNGEVIVGWRDRIWVTSTAAGPAFEGWHMKCGMRAVSGAIESVRDCGKKLDIKVVGGVAPEGISGSGFIDIVGILLKRGLIDKSGRINRDFTIYNGEQRKIFITQNDIRQVQLAKAAFSTGIGILREKARLKSDIMKFIITGNFGNYLNKKNAQLVGIIPKDISLKKVIFLKNGALNGACIFIKNKDILISRIEDILRKIEHISLEQQPNFKMRFIQAMYF